MHHVRVALDHHVFRQADGARSGDAADIVAAQVDEHEMLGDFLGVGEQFRLHGAVLGLAAPAAPRTRDRSHRDAPLLGADEDLGR